MEPVLKVLEPKTEKKFRDENPWKEGNVSPGESESHVFISWWIQRIHILQNLHHWVYVWFDYLTVLALLLAPSTRPKHRPRELSFNLGREQTCFWSVRCDFLDLVIFSREVIISIIHCGKSNKWVISIKLQPVLSFHIRTDGTHSRIMSEPTKFYSGSRTSLWS